MDDRVSVRFKAEARLRRNRQRGFHGLQAWARDEAFFLKSFHIIGFPSSMLLSVAATWSDAKAVIPASKTPCRQIMTSAASAMAVGLRMRTTTQVSCKPSTITSAALRITLCHQEIGPTRRVRETRHCPAPDGAVKVA